MLRSLFIAVLFLVGAIPLWAAPPEPVEMPPITHADALLTLVASDGRELRFTPAELEALPTYRLKTTTPWRDIPAVFEGVLLRDLLAQAGLDDVEEILVTAENEFVSSIPRAVWEQTQMIVATRVNGAAHNRRARGPIQFVLDAESYANSDIVTESHLVWMAARIEAAN